MKKIIMPIALVIVLAIGIFAGSFFFGGSKTTYDGTTEELSFKNIGELATQSVIGKEIQTIENDGLSPLGFSLPFTDSKYIYSYAVEIKAGYNFEEITWEVDDTNKKVIINMPETKVLSVEVDRDSFQVFLQSDGIGQKISLDEINKSEQELEQRAQEDAIENGLYELAQENAKLLINNMVYAYFDPKEYTIEYHFATSES